MAEPFFCRRSESCPSCLRPRAGRLNGQLLPINQNQALFSLLGTTFGGDGRVNFALPDLRGRTPIHVGSGHTLGERGGEQAHTLSIAELPTHTHVAHGVDDASSATVPTRPAVLAAADHATLYGAGRQPGGDEPAIGDQRRRQPGAPEHAAVPDPQLLHRAAGHLPVAELEETHDGTTLCRRDPDVRRATSPRPAGCSARGSCCRSRRTRRCSS